MKNFPKLLMVIGLSLFTSCLSDIDNVDVNIELQEEAKILHYLEANGDFANSEFAPAIIEPSVLYNNLQSHFILDIRDFNVYLNGHIEYSLNIATESLYEITDSLNSFHTGKKIVIVCNDGQASAYFTCLLRMANFENVFCLKYGMAYWNNDFSSQWLSVLGEDIDGQKYDNIIYPKYPLTSLPDYNFPISLKSIEQKVLYRIKEVIKNGFKSNINYTQNFDSATKSTHLKICYGVEKLYNYPPRDLGFRGHAAGTLWYSIYPNSDFNSSECLQTLPTDQKILIYSGDGQLSACMVAYLTVLGYDVKTLLYGANQLFYSRLRLDPLLEDVAFKSEDIMNYPYVIGN